VTSDDPSTPPYGEQGPYIPQPGAGAQPPPPSDGLPDPTQQFQPPQPPKKRRVLVLASVLGVVVAGAVAAAVVDAHGSLSSGRPGTPATSVRTVTDANGVTCLSSQIQADGYCPGDSSPALAATQFTDPAGGTCPASEESGGYCPGDSPSPTPPPPPPPTYNPVTDSQWQLIQENPSGYVGQTFTVYGTVTQHDANTGADEFRADAGPADDPNTNTIFDGSNDGSQVAPLQVGQNFAAEVSVEGSISYTTTLGGTDTAPELLVVSITQT
jgi:hypothetical protein